MPLRGILLIVFVLGSLPVCFIRPFYGLILWIGIALLDPQWYTYGAARALPWAMAVAIPTLLGLFVFGRGWTRSLMSRELALIVALWVWFTVTSIISTHTPLFFEHAADTWYRWSFVSKVLLMTVAMIPIVNTFARLRILLISIATCFGIIVVKAIPFYFRTGGGQRLYGPEKGMMADNNDFGLALNMTLPIFFFLAQTESNRWMRRVWWFLFLCAIPGILFTYSRGAVVGLVVIAVLMFLQLRQRLLLVPMIAVGLLVALLLTPDSWRERMNPTRPDAVDSSARSRLNVWRFSWLLAKDHPLTGGGFDTFTPALFTRYGTTEAAVHGPHSVYFGVLAEHGFPGLYLYVTFMTACLMTARRLVKWGREMGNTMVASYAQMFTFSMIAFLVSGTFLGRAYFDYFFTIAACLLILKRLCILEGVDPSLTEDEQVACVAA